MSIVTNLENDENRNWLSDFYSELPSNVIFNKVRTGCGGTTLEIENMNRDSIITVPYRTMIWNKSGQFPNERTPELNLLGVCEGVYYEEIRDYLLSNEVHKILCTWDSLHRVKEVIEDLGQRELRKYFLLVDEVHCMSNHYTLRKKAIANVLNSFNRDFERWAFMTATPIDQEFVLEELKGIPVVIAEGMEPELPQVNNLISTQLLSDTCKMVKDFIDNRLTNCHLFCNSLKFIGSVVNECGLTNENCKIVWGDSNKEYIGEAFGITKGSPGSAPKKINMYTSTSFEGCDIFDEEGEIVIVSDGYQAHTLNDIYTTFPQIIGRLRNTKYNSEITHIFRKTSYSGDQSFEEFKEYTQSKVENARLIIDAYNKCNGFDQEEDILNELYITKEDGKFKLEMNLVNIDLLNYRNTHETYLNAENVCIAQNKAGMKSRVIKLKYMPSDRLQRNNKARITFKEAFIEYTKLKNRPGRFCTSPVIADRIALLEIKYDIIQEAFEKLGPEEVEKLNYNQQTIRRKLISISDRTHENKIKELLIESGIRPNENVSLACCKKAVEEVYTEIGIEKNAKATDIEKYFDVETRKILENRKYVNGYFIKGERLYFIN